jgi:hypothetical protein
MILNLDSSPRESAKLFSDLPLARPAKFAIKGRSA